MPEDGTQERLVVDAMLGKLATYLRMCGYDTAYALDRDAEADDALLDLAVSEDRQLITRDTDLAARAPDSVLLSEREIEGQLQELADAGFRLSLAPEPAHCGVCNGPVDEVKPEEPTPEYAPNANDETVWRCTDCGQHFWKGSHWASVEATLDGL
ncbi:Mut7-C RNAse domain-containing protein [Haloarcula sp. S1AR25-5A]|uniref:Mut7-C RNAse domain-containing protein n=1 Tax=Haloarcula terrestris TaxID=2950533 RepID=A0AAE4EW86_9EURY|nr:Mut7-C RNAse domain-containing protein [Haloarcula terrestris]MDS0221336.1 Mut7-C RNAse domain-containing protein [Haloarcula terrestris]